MDGKVRFESAPPGEDQELCAGEDDPFFLCVVL